MKRDFFSSNLSIILILIILTPSISLLSFLFMSESPNFFSFLMDCINTGKPLILQSFPYIHIFWFLPDKFQFGTFTVGQLVDLIIIFIIAFHIQFAFYPTIKRLYLMKEYKITFDVDMLFLKSEIDNDNDILSKNDYESTLIDNELLLNNLKLTFKTINLNNSKIDYNYIKNIYNKSLKINKIQTFNDKNSFINNNSGYFLPECDNNFQSFYNFSTFKNFSWRYHNGI